MNFWTEAHCNPTEKTYRSPISNTDTQVICLFGQHTEFIYFIYFAGTSISNYQTQTFYYSNLALKLLLLNKKFTFILFCILSNFEIITHTDIQTNIESIVASIY